MQGIVSMPQEQWRYLTCLTMMYLQRCWRLWTLLNLETGCSNWTRIGPKTWRMKMCQELKLKINMGNWLSTHWSPVQKEQVSAGSRMLHSIFNEVNNSVALELRKTSKAEVTWTSYMLTSDICNLKEMVYPRLFEKKDEWHLSSLPWSCSILTCRTNPFSLKVRLQIVQVSPHTLRCNLFIKYRYIDWIICEMHNGHLKM